MSQKPRVLVMGATGQVGGALLALLAENDSVEVVAAARNPVKAAALTVPNVHLDLDDVSTFKPALEGVDRIFMATAPWVRTELLNSKEEPRAMPLDEFLQGTMAALSTDANEVMVPRAKFLREQAGPNEAAFVTSFNEQLEAPQIN